MPGFDLKAYEDGVLKPLRPRMPNLPDDHVTRYAEEQRGAVEALPSGARRVCVYAGVDPLTGRRHYLREAVPAGHGAQAAADKVLRQLAGQVDERRNPRTNATVDQLLDRHFELLDIEPDTVENYRRLARLHVRPLIGGQKVGALDADVSPPRV